MGNGRNGLISCYSVSPITVAMSVLCSCKGSCLVREYNGKMSVYVKRQGEWGRIRESLVNEQEVEILK